VRSVEAGAVEGHSAVLDERRKELQAEGAERGWAGRWSIENPGARCHICRQLNIAKRLVSA